MTKFFWNAFLWFPKDTPVGLCMIPSVPSTRNSFVYSSWRRKPAAIAVNSVGVFPTMKEG